MDVDTSQLLRDAGLLQITDDGPKRDTTTNQITAELDQRGYGIGQTTVIDSLAGLAAKACWIGVS